MDLKKSFTSDSIKQLEIPFMMQENCGVGSINSRTLCKAMFDFDFLSIAKLTKIIWHECTFSWYTFLTPFLMCLHLPFDGNSLIVFTKLSIALSFKSK